MNPILEMIPINGRISFNDQTFNFGDPNAAQPQAGDVSPSEGRSQEGDNSPLGTLPPVSTPLPNFSQNTFQSAIPNFQSFNSPDMRSSQPNPQNFEMTSSQFDSLLSNTSPQLQNNAFNQPIAQSFQTRTPSLESLLSNPNSQNIAVNQANSQTFETRTPSFGPLMANAFPFNTNNSERQSIDSRIPSIESLISNMVPRNGQSVGSEQQNSQIITSGLQPMSFNVVPQNQELRSNPFETFESRIPTIADSFATNTVPQTQNNQQNGPVLEINVGPQNQISGNVPFNQQNFDSRAPSPSFEPLPSPLEMSSNSGQNFRQTSEQANFGPLISEVPLQPQDVRPNPANPRDPISRIPDLVTLLTPNGAMDQQIEPSSPNFEGPRPPPQSFN